MSGHGSGSRQVLRFDDEVGVRLIPDVQARLRQGDDPYLMRTNVDGFRTAEVSRERPAGKRRILFFGDSFTEGVGVSDGERFSDLIEQMVPDTEVLNFGVRATGTDQQLLFFREMAHRFEHDLVVVGLFTGDVQRNHSKYGVLTSATGEHYQKPYFRVEDDQLALHNVPVPRLAADYRSLGRSEQELVYYRGLKYRLRVLVRRFAPWAKPALQRLTRYNPAPTLRSPDHPAWRLTTAIVRQWATEADTPLLVLAIPPYQYVERTASSGAYRSRFQELGDEEGVSVHDCLDDLVAAAKSLGPAAIRIAGDAHYSAEGHAVIARSVAPAIAAQLKQVAS